ncbi:MAG: Fe-S-containing protein [Methanosarcinaceae archaeon]|nr:DUF2318 domain-containing protein [Methanosarcinaceae archaeon]MDF1533776.1 Fe-S-containing protein [Methanosarcinaceae archaeon]
MKINLKNVRSIGIVMMLLLVSAFGLGCIGGDSGKAQAGPVKATWITADVNGDVVSIPVADVNDNTNVHFKVNTNTELGEIAVMAFVLGDEIVIRSNVCPPCRSIGFTLDDAVLVCDSCGTTFDAETGNGIQGACVAYPKESIPYTESGGIIVMDINDVITAHQNTVIKG